MSELSIEVRGSEELANSIPPRINTRAALAAGAGEYKKCWREHFQALDSKGNRRGFPSRNFWIQEGFKKTEVGELTPEYATILCDSRAVAFQAFGGTIRPRTGKCLAIPVSPEAYAAGWPSNSGLPLEFIPIRNARTPAVRGKLVEARATRIGYSAKRGVFSKGENTKTVGKTHYLLVSKVERPVGLGDAVRPPFAPSESRVAEKIMGQIQRQLERKGASANVETRNF